MSHQGWTFPIALVIGLLAGCLLGAQPSANGYLGRYVGHPLHASTISFASGTGLLLVVLIAIGQFPPRMTASVSSLPWWAWSGGAIGTILVTASLYFVPKVGSLAWFGAVITGQIVAALVLDQFGWLGNPRQPANGLRLIGALLLVVGIVCIALSRQPTAKKAKAEPIIGEPMIGEPIIGEPDISDLATAKVIESERLSKKKGQSPKST